MGLFGSGVKDGALLLAQEISLSGQFAQRYKLRVMAKEEALKEEAENKLERLLAYKRSFNCTDARIGFTIFFYKAVNRRGAPR